jgi:hypothetical protein
MKRQLVLLSSLLLLLTLVVTAQPGNSQAVVEATPVSAVEVAPEMAVAPTNCGILPEPLAIDPLITHATGTWPIWVALPNWDGVRDGVLVVPNERNQESHELPGWWSTKVAWFIPLSYTGEVQVQGFNVDDQSPIYFEFNAGPTEVATLNPEQPGGFVEALDQWAFFPSYMWFAKAGCYRLEAKWDGGLWQQIIAVGRLEE